MYKDPAKRRDKDRERQRRYRASKGVTSQNVTIGVTNEAQTSPVVDEVETIDSKVPLDQANIPADKREQIRDELSLTANPQVMAICSKRLKKRGKDIKCFADLPPDVQATINRISQSNEEKAKRTKIAIQYQHLYPDRFHSTGLA